MIVYGEAVAARFAAKHPNSRKPLARFVEISRAAVWRHMPDIKATLPATDFDPETGEYIFDIGGNKYRLMAIIDFEEQSVAIDAVMTHEEYNRR